MTPYRRIFCIAVAIFCFVGFCTQSVSAATVYVNSGTGNDTTGNGSIGLPYKTFTKAYASSSPGDTLKLSGTFDWSNASETADVIYSGITLSKDLILEGDGPDATIIQAGTSTNPINNNKRVFTIGTTTSITIRNMSIKNGWLRWDSYTSNTYGGGAIRNNGNLVVQYVEFSNNTAAGCSYCGMGYGGAIYTYTGATTTIDASTFYNNAAWYTGGALSSQGYTTVKNSTFFNNTTMGDQAASNYGAGIGVLSGTTTITNITMAGNGAKNGGGLYIAGASTTVYLKNSIIATNNASTTAYGNIYRSAGTLVNNGYNVVGTSTGFASTTGDWYDFGNTGSYRLSGSATTGTINLDTQLSYNDAETTLTRTLALQQGSIAIHGGNGTANNSEDIPTSDQRASTRSGAVDIGAYEYDGGGLSPATPTIQASGITISNNQYKQQTFSWTNGNGMRRVVFMKQTSSGTASPTNGTRYTASSTFGMGNQIGSSGWYAVAEGYMTSVTVTGLTQGTDYRIQIFEYGGVDSSNSVYATSTASNNPKSLTTYTPTTRYVDATNGNDSTGDGTQGAPWKTFTKAYASSSPGDTLDAVGTFDLTATAETGDVQYYGFQIMKDFNIRGHGADQTIFQATSTGGRRVFTVATNTVATIDGVTIKQGSVDWPSYTLNTLGGGGVRNDGTLTITNSEFTNNRAAGCLYCSMGYGGAVYTHTGATTTISGSTFYNNSAWYAGGAISSQGYMEISNSTIYANGMFGDQTASNYGAGIGILRGTAAITNVTMTANGAIKGGGLYIENASSTVFIRNNIFAGNNASTTAFGNIYRVSGTLTNNGYNIVGTSTGFASTTGDWYDFGNTGSYRLSGSTATGTLSLDSSAAINSNPYNTRTFALLANSIAINRGTSTVHSGFSVPTTDQRGASRAGVTDIGAFEYDGVISGGDTTAPTVSLTAPSNAGIVYGPQVTLSANASDDVGIASVVFYVDNTVVASTTSTSSIFTTTWNSTSVGNGSKTIIAVARDTSGNVATSSSISVTVENSGPTPMSVAVNPTSSTATFTWTTTDFSSSQVVLGLITTTNGTVTLETDTSPRVQEHTVVISNLPACTGFKYNVVSTNESSISATSSEQSFYTLGCTGSASVIGSSESGFATTTGGVLTEGILTLEVPTNFTSTSSSAVFQAKTLKTSNFFASAGNPAGVSRVGSTVINLTAIVGTSTILSSFTQPLTVSMTYTPQDIASIDESSLKIYRYSGSVWYLLSNCVVNTGAKTVTCETQNFSDFALFGNALPSQNTSNTASTISSGPTGGGGEVMYGCRDPKATNYNEFVSHTQKLCVYISTVTPPVRFTRNLKMGYTGVDVRSLQQLLNAHGFMIAQTGPGSVGNETTKFGSATKTAVMKLQKKIGVAVTGFFGPKTREYVNKHYLD